MAFGHKLEEVSMVVKRRDEVEEEEERRGWNASSARYWAKPNTPASGGGRCADTGIDMMLTRREGVEDLREHT